jgi:hypothetical protein
MALDLGRNRHDRIHWLVQDHDLLVLQAFAMSKSIQAKADMAISEDIYNLSLWVKAYGR